MNLFKIIEFARQSNLTIFACGPLSLRIQWAHLIRVTTINFMKIRLKSTQKSAPRARCHCSPGDHFLNNLIRQTSITSNPIRPKIIVSRQESDVTEKKKGSRKKTKARQRTEKRRTEQRFMDGTRSSHLCSCGVIL